MKRERSAPDGTARLSGTSESSGAWSIPPGDDSFPTRLRTHPRAADWRKVYGIGNRDILRRPCLGLICSVQCPGGIVIKTFDAMRELRDAGIVVAGGFHSPMEQECLEFLLRGDQPVIICPAKHPAGVRIPSAWRAALNAGRLVLVSPFDDNVRRTTQAQSQTRNEFVAALSAAVFIPHASPGGKAEVTARRICQFGRPLFTLEDEANIALKVLGASPYAINKVK